MTLIGVKKRKLRGNLYTSRTAVESRRRSQGLLASHTAEPVVVVFKIIERIVETIFCGVTTVRMVSSGEFDNAVTVQLRQAGEEDINSASLICGL
ncbi:hypothetical protein J6590_060840 [Homalodisca vitripennis]|nr:hypothetical protein J6590_060840 [Homalodisca vitripennis]